MADNLKVIIYCDGACLGNPGPGGFAALLIHKGKKTTEKVVYGNEKDTTNNRMELKAAISGLNALKKQCDIEIFSDSKYVIDGITKWIKGWQEKNFTNAQKKPVANKDLWLELLAVSLKHNITWRWVKGHSGDELNDRVDEIAKEQAAIAAYER